MQVPAVSGETGEGLGHVRGDRAEAPSHLAGHHLEEGMAVGSRQGIGVAPVDLELGVAILVVRSVRLPAQLFHVADESAEVGHVRRETLEVVAGLLHAVDAVRIEGDDGAVVLAQDQKVLRLHSRHQAVSRGAEARDRSTQDGARAVGPLTAVDLNVARKAGDPFLPGHTGVAREVRDRDHVVEVRSLPHARHGGACEAGAPRQEIAQLAGWHSLATRRSVQVDILSQDIVDLVLLEPLPNINVQCIPP